VLGVPGGATPTGIELLKGKGFRERGGAAAASLSREPSKEAFASMGKVGEGKVMTLTEEIEFNLKFFGSNDVEVRKK